MKSFKVAVPKAEVGEEEVLQVSEQKIKEDMKGRKIKFDLTREDRYWYKNPEKFWEEFQDTSEVKVPEKFEDWLIGQDRVKHEARLQLEEWVRKLQDINEMRKKGAPVMDILRERPGPYLLLVGSPGCLDGNTRVALEDGSFVKIRELGQKHLQAIDVGLQTPEGIDRAKVFHLYDGQPTLRVLLRSGREIIGTHNHPLMTPEGWKRLDELKPGDRLVCQREVKSSITKEVPTGWVRSLSQIGPIEKRTHLYYETIKIPSTFNPQLAYLMGYILGDGSVDTHRVQLFVAETERELVDPLVMALQDQFGVSPKVYIKPLSGKRKVPVHRLRVDSTLLASFLALDCPVPEFVFRSPNKTVASFLRGLFDADGHVTTLRDKRDGSYATVVGLKQKNVDRLRAVQLLLLRFGIHSRVYEDAILLKICDNWSLIQFAMEIGFSVAHKKEKLGAGLEQMRRIVKYDRAIDEIVSVESAGIRDVYDIEVPETHTFIASGIVSHNTGKSLLTKILAADLERLYEKHGIKLYDMMLVKNRHNKFQPHNRIVPAGIGRRIVDVAIRERTIQGQRRGRWIFAGLMSMVIFGLVMMGTAFYNLALVMGQMGVVDGWTKAGAAVLQPWMAVGAIFTIFPLFLILGGRAFGINWRAPTEKELLDTPHLLVDNGSGRKLYVNSTISNSGKLFGDLEWCNTAETLVSDPRGRLYRICSADYQALLGGGKNPILMRHSFEQEIIAIRTQSGKVLRGNPSHPVMTRDGWKHLKDITEGVEVQVATELPMPVGNARLNWAKTISVYHGRNMAMHDALCPAEACEGLASLAGWLVAEGWVSYFNQDRPRALHAEVPPSEAAFIDHMSEEVQQLFGLKPAILKVSHSGAYGQASEMIRLTVNSVDVASWLAEDVAEKRVPDWVLASGEGASSAFLRWLFEGDGCVSIASKGRFGVILSQKNPQLLRDVQTMLLRYGIQSSILKRKGREEHSLWIRRGRDLRIFHERIGFVSEGKKAKLGRLVGLLPERTVTPSPWEAVVEVTRQAPEAVYGFMLGGDSTYWSNGILSHNSPFGEHPQLATPTHKRVVAGDVHHANMKILYIDELRNMDERMAVELLTVMEDGTAPIRGHQSMGGTHTASQNVETGPVDAMFFLIASANMDMIHDPHSILNLIPAFKDRFNYGNIVMMETEMEATPENEIKVAQVVSDECFPPGTQLLTPGGWKRIEDFQAGDQCLSLNPATKEIETAKVRRTIVREHSGELVRFRSRYADLSVTPGHLMFLRHARRFTGVDAFSEPFFIRADEAAAQTRGKSVFGTVWNREYIEDADSIKRVSLWDSVDDSYLVAVRYHKKGDGRFLHDAKYQRVAHGKYQTALSTIGDDPALFETTNGCELFLKEFEGTGGRWRKGWDLEAGDFAELLGWYISEGCTIENRVFISQDRRVNGEKHGRIVALLERMGLQPRPNGDYVSFSNRLIADYLRENCGEGAYFKRIPEEAFHWGPSARRRLWEALILGDGHLSGSGDDNWVLDTVSPSLVEDFLRLSVLVGRFAHEIKPYGGHFRRASTGRDGGKTLWSVTKEPYNGNVYCVELEKNHVVLAKQNSKLMWVGQCYRFNLLPMEKAGVREIIDYMRRKASSNKKLSITFRSVIKLLKKSAQLGWAEHETMIRAHHVRAAIEEHAKPIEQQVMEQQVERQRPYKIIQREGSKVGVVNGLVLLHDALSGEGTGDVASVAVWMQKVEDPQRADFVVTGINEDKNTWIADSKRHVRTAVLKMYGVDISRDYYTHITFMQNKGVDGPSAGITMTLAIMSFLGDPSLPPEERVPIPLRQDVAVTGAVEIIAADGGVNRADVVVSPVGGIPDKVRGASRWGIKNVLIPLENWEHSLDESDRKNLGVTVVGCRTVQDYLTWIRADGKRPMEVESNGN